MKASELKNLDVRELIDELNSLDFENVGGWPMPVKIGAEVGWPFGEPPACSTVTA